MLTSTYIQAQNTSAVENGRYGLGSLFLSTGALRHLSGGIFVRACITLTSERCGTSKDVLRPVAQSANPRCLALHLGRWVRGFTENNWNLVMQENSSIGASAPVLSIVKNQVTALSTDVAQFFGKLHKHVIRDIENLLSNLPAERQSNFGQTFVTRANPKNPQVKIQSKAYRMTRDGFTLLVMGWTGEKALQFKLAWLDAFNKMEEELRAKNTVQALPLSSPLGKSIAPAINAAPMLHGQLQCVQLAMKDRFTNQRDLLRAYSILQHHFCVTSYRQIPAARFDELMDYIKSMEMKPLRVKKSNAFLATSDNDLISRFGITIINGEPKIYELGDAWHLVRVGSYEWIKAYCENRLPANQVPDLLKALLHRLNKETL